MKDAVFEQIRKLQGATKFQLQKNGKYIPVSDKFSGTGVEERNYLTFH